MAITEEKISFVLYGSYEEQVNMLTNEQAGQLFKSIFAYANTGEKHCDDPMALMMLSFISHQMDIDARKYAEKLERIKEAGRKAGKASAAKRALQKQEAEQRLATTVDDCQRFQHVDVYVDEDVDADEDVYVDVDADVIDLEQQQQRQQEEGEDTHACAEPDEDRVIFLYGENEIPTNAVEYVKFRDLAEELCVKYGHKRLTPMDIEQTLEAAYRPAYNDDGQSYAVYDRARAELLEYAFRQAAVQDQVKWSYVNTILDKYRKNGIETIEQAQEYEYRRNRGEVA